MAGGHAGHQCPLCGSPLSREHYESVLHIDEARKQELAREEQDLANQRRQLTLQRHQIASDAQETAKKAEAKARREVERLEQDVRSLKAALAAKAKVGAADKARLEREANRKAEARNQDRLRKLEEALQRAEQRRDRDAEMWKRKIDELQQRAEARDRLHFGPEGEEELEAVLRRHFTTDDIDRRGRGGDIIHTVVDRGKPCGKIVYECKRTSDWQSGYVRQLKRAMETHGTRYGILVSRVLPPKQSGCCLREGVIVSVAHLAHHLAAIVRETIVEIARAQLSEEGKAEKTQEVYRYLRGEEFRSALLAVEERTKELRTSLEREKSSHETWWNVREQHYGIIARHTSGVSSRIKDILAALPERRVARLHRLES